MYMTIKEIIDAANQHQCSISELMIQQEMKTTDLPRHVIWEKMEKNLDVMKKAVERSSTGDGVFSPTGLTGGDAVKMKKYRENGKTLSGDAVLAGVQYALGTNEVNAAMGVVCATPTAGASGTLPGVIFSIADTLKLTKEQQIRCLFTSALFGMVVANRAMIAGAVGGCQAEVGSASAMAAAAAVEAAGGTPQQCSEAFSISLGNLLGLVCDPVAGLVEIPCVKRNAIGATNALIAADMALAGITNPIPADETIDAMRSIGLRMPRELKETGLGGTAATKTGIDIAIKILGRDMSIHPDNTD
ncbi:L-serine ammonia-lyase, iron-sulfur-dependent, subunit alpha [Granulicatella sp. zg-ZJ]|uniref:L-serine ammonia-lyase, iron-sulfur-dependent, subunit alpha n=1 Tax=unclassified Granulicatella TaxID=2630493 RepID=UPI0013BF2B5C|nr:MULTISPECIES: L-serine ammonia-lyase, iron-sulfur-dependent, subunit alpha [unclassified Granulicatella]MBS4750261.1 L-serine ammonia-lyase, iron-sulfur-dependent, subunit alpha [Carnobacteriaceae bacterium zg-ZUI78]NEW62503.1 L-serine ammonia-lyase, iron-sulfur-dependent, subunit alpha [Granulicatella sp. zg-ZJ]NEW66550.1 L-serine ammonia-lyase, iron-sulfur-dependent, subunit alpha [Granulicatella sp. zg-84]QMI85801.1 L-serine ammonia-lyase, iron-sulfur-dependent, subunit alpha [Carnobacter